MRRRQLLTATALGAASIAGCSGSSGETGGTPTPEPTATPTATVETLYQRIYGEHDIEGANALYHPDVENPPIDEEDFQPYGGLESMTAEVRSTEVVAESEAEAEVHATVFYTTPVGSAEHVDWFTLAPHEDDWLILSWEPQSLR
jgi:hypothetical protein